MLAKEKKSAEESLKKLDLLYDQNGSPLPDMHISHTAWNLVGTLRDVMQQGTPLQKLVLGEYLQQTERTEEENTQEDEGDGTEEEDGDDGAEQEDEYLGSYSDVEEMC